MTDHLHIQFTPGCYRCELSRDEALSELCAAEVTLFEATRILVAELRRDGNLTFTDAWAALTAGNSDFGPCDKERLSLAWSAHDGLA